MTERIKFVRKTFNLTQSEFGERIGVKGNTVTGYETGIRTPSEAILLAICREFKVDETWLRTGAGEPFPKRNRDEELGAFFGSVLAEDPGFKKRLLSVLSRLDESEWKLLERMADKLVAEAQKEKADP